MQEICWFVTSTENMMCTENDLSICPFHKQEWIGITLLAKHLDPFGTNTWISI